MLRPFHGDQSLLEIILERFQGRPEVHVAAYEPEFQDLAAKHGVSFIQRTLESALAEDAYTIHQYLHDIDEVFVCHLNACCPFLKAKTVDDAIRTFLAKKPQSLFSVRETHELIFDSSHKNINTEIVFNSKLRKPNYIGNNSIMIYDKRVLFRDKVYWDYTEDNPYLYVMDAEESIDIDTELDFRIAQVLYESRTT